jgi:hypothetical protein
MAVSFIDGIEISKREAIEKKFKVFDLTCFGMESMI